VGSTILLTLWAFLRTDVQPGRLALRHDLWLTGSASHSPLPPNKVVRPNPVYGPKAFIAELYPVPVRVKRAVPCEQGM
jgi:hypothetical protein